MPNPRNATLRSVQRHCGRFRWFRQTTRRGDYFAGKPGKWFTLPRKPAGTPEQRADFLALIRKWRWLLGARWENPLAWAVTFGLLELQEATALTLARKLDETRRA